MNLQTISYTENPENTPKSKATSLTVPGRCPGELHGLIDVGGSRVQKELVASPSANKCHTENIGQCGEGRQGDIYSWFLFKKPICMALLCILKAVYRPRLCLS